MSHDRWCSIKYSLHTFVGLHHTIYYAMQSAPHNDLHHIMLFTTSCSAPHHAQHHIFTSCSAPHPDLHQIMFCTTPWSAPHHALHHIMFCTTPCSASHHALHHVHHASHHIRLCTTPCFAPHPDLYQTMRATMFTIRMSVVDTWHQHCPTWCCSRWNMSQYDIPRIAVGNRGNRNKSNFDDQRLSLKVGEVRLQEWVSNAAIAHARVYGKTKARLQELANRRLDSLSLLTRRESEVTRIVALHNFQVNPTRNCSDGCDIWMWCWYGCDMDVIYGCVVDMDVIYGCDVDMDVIYGCDDNNNNERDMRLGG